MIYHPRLISEFREYAFQQSGASTTNSTKIWLKDKNIPTLWPLGSPDLILTDIYERNISGPQAIKEGLWYELQHIWNTYKYPRDGYFEQNSSRVKLMSHNIEVTGRNFSCQKCHNDEKSIIFNIVAGCASRKCTFALPYTIFIHQI